jgi:NitT/TauT family transport system ATP-binding protein
MSAAPPIPRTAGLSIQVREMTRTFDTAVTALRDFSLDVPAGQFVAILGPSGCGKSTLLRLIANLDKPQSGSVFIDGASSHDSHSTHDRSRIAYVFQDAHLLPWRTALHNVVLPLELMNASKSGRFDAARHALDAVGLADSLNRYPAQLSGGMRMRVSLARAMVTQPRLLLLDEPFAALDEITRQRLDEQLRDLWAAASMTVVFVTHSTAEAVFLAQRAVVLSARPGRIIEDRQIDLPDHRPASLRATAAFAQQTRAIYDALERGDT